MIYVIISDAYCTKIRNNYCTNNDKSNTDEKIKDCDILSQSSQKLPIEILKYIENTKNHQRRNERACAYTSLFFGLDRFFGIENAKISRTVDGKPYIIDYDSNQKENISIGISHSNGATAVAISDEGEIGIDIQSEIDEVSAERLNQRFLHDFKTENVSFNVKFFVLSHESSLSINEISLIPYSSPDFLFSWTAAESLIKLSGEGFLKISSIDKLSEIADTSVKQIYVNNKKYALSLSKYK